MIVLGDSFLNWEWYADINTMKLFLHLLLKASREDTIVRGQKILRGQLLTSRKELVSATGLSDREIRTAITHLLQSRQFNKTNDHKNDPLIVHETTNKVTKITICNYDSYEFFALASDQQNDQRSDQQNDTKTAFNKKESNKETEKKKGGTKEIKDKEIYKEKNSEESIIIDNAKEKPQHPLKVQTPSVSATPPPPPIVLREKKFGQSLIPFVAMYGKEMIREFYDYWTEPNKSGTKMRFELERTWDTKRRLATWDRNKKMRHKDYDSNEDTRAAALRAMEAIRNAPKGEDYEI